MAFEVNDIISRGGAFGGGGDGGFGGGGLIAGLVLGTLFNRRGGLGGEEGGCGSHRNDCATTGDLLQQTLGDIKASVPLAEAQVQLALAGVQDTITTQANANAQYVAKNITDSTQFLNQGNTAILLAQQSIAASLARDIATVDTNVDRQATALQIAINTDGERTRSLIVANQIAELNQKLTVAQLDGLELRQRNERDRERHSVEITMTNNQNQNQLQFQAQSQTLQTLSHGLLDALQSIRATNAAINIGGTQLASPTNTNSNVRA